MPLGKEIAEFTGLPLDKGGVLCYHMKAEIFSAYANMAQVVEQLTRNEQVARSNRVSSSKDGAIPFGIALFFLSFGALIAAGNFGDNRVSDCSGSVAPSKRPSQKGWPFVLSEMVVTWAVEDARPYETVGTHPHPAETPP